MRKLQRQIPVKMRARNRREPSYQLDDFASDAEPLPVMDVPVLDLTGDVHWSGIKRGMRVLELGCGVGDVSLWIAKLVGPAGFVVGVDESAEAIDVAEKRATVAGQCYWTRFVIADPATFIPHERYDVVIVHGALPSERERATFSRLYGCVSPDGIIIIVTGQAGSTDNRSS